MMISTRLSRVSHLVKQIISEHLGEVNVRSVQGQGTTFEMLFPIRWKEGKLRSN